MAWQGNGGAGGPGEPPEDDTRVDWPMAGSNAAQPPPQSPTPPAPPPAPEAPAANPVAEPGGYTYPAELTGQPAYVPPVIAAPPVTGPPPAEPSLSPEVASPAAPPPVPPAAPPPPGSGYPPASAGYPPQGSGYPPASAGFQPGGAYPPAGTWQPSQPVVAVPGSLKFGGVLPRLLAYWLDGILISLAMVLIGGVLGAIAGSGVDSFIISTVLSVGISALYFIGFWTADGRATLGMRLFHLQIGHAADGRTLTVGQAVTRWAALGYPFALLGVIPALSIPVSGLLVIWELVLLVTTATSPTRQGLHDRIAGSALVAPEGNEGPVIPCLVLAVVLFVVLPFLAVIGLVALSAQVSDILREVGTSV